ncbi:MAG: glycosyl transferase family 1 [Flavobacteriales bacterium]|nr:glycosyl transferase family 1 [Flavobacteriales bacterium]
MKIGILGTRGIPNNYGGFEQFADYLAGGLVEKGREVYVYNSHNHPYQEKTYKGAHIIHVNDPEHKVGTAGQFIYDFNCIMDSRKRDFDILLQLGYTSSSVWSSLMPKASFIVTNMDGLEWKRSKYSKPVQQFLKQAEKWAARSSHHLVADSIGIQTYLKDKYHLDSTYIPYGAEVFVNPNAEALKEYGVEAGNFALLIARMEPENNVETILKAYDQLDDPMPLLVVGRTDNKFGGYLKKQFDANPAIRFMEGIYDFEKLNNLRYYSSIYFHGHSVGGTNPSLLEAMAASAYIIAHDNVFNKAILGEDASYFNNDSQLLSLLKEDIAKESKAVAIKKNIEKVESKYSWSQIINSYDDLFANLVGEKG